jgi:hypothetical protein
MRCTLAPVILVCSCFAACSETSEIAPEGPPAPIYVQNFAAESALEKFQFTDPEAWEWNDEEGIPSLELLGASEYSPPHRSPHSIALVDDLIVGDFDLEVDLLQTGREYGHRDMCLFFGFESPSRFYYVHLASKPDPHAHNIFLVDGAARRAIAPVGEKGIDWGEESWHRVRLERRLEDGSIRVFFDDLETPVLETTDTTLEWGRIGFGSFDDSGRVAKLRVWAPATLSPPPGEVVFPVR